MPKKLPEHVGNLERILFARLLRIVGKPIKSICNPCAIIEKMFFPYCVNGLQNHSLSLPESCERGKDLIYVIVSSSTIDKIHKITLFMKIGTNSALFTKIGTKFS